MTYLEYSRITWSQFVLKVEGNNKKELEHWKKLRLISWLIYQSIPLKEGNSYTNMFEWFKLPGDPTPKQLEKQMLQDRKREIKANKAQEQRLIKALIEKGMYKDGKISYN